MLDKCVACWLLLVVLVLLLVFVGFRIPTKKAVFFLKPTKYPLVGRWPLVFLPKNLVKSLKMCIFNSSVGLLVGLTAK